MKKLLKGILVIAALATLVYSVPSNNTAADEIDVPKIRSIKFDV